MTTVGTVGKLYLVDTSAQTRTNDPAVRSIIAGLIADGAAATCVTVDLEAGFSGRNHQQLQTIAERRRSLYVTLPFTEAVAERARAVQLRLAARGQQRAAGVVDVLTAAVAEEHGAVILHYDKDFEHIAAVTGQPHLWVAPRGSLD
ncbi:PIN domain-containing protein [Kribbella sp.]|uniref:PIN domain-containing protein n=1 Tax=Kribbella sp. TaxID=1871183 RepID=UPI002D22445A|nr:PIN domain-containing protein [Kribbella sp.]HZX04210.1 PIN domain-containing protein [Kribbella sp.]